MGKTDFSKVENALAAGLEKMQVAHLLELADSATGTKKQKNEKQQRQVLILLQHVLNKLHDQDHSIYKTLDIQKKELKVLIEKKEELSEEEWTRILEIKEKVDAHAKKTLPKPSQKSNEELIEQERKRHLKKRFNTNEKWLPLDIPPV